MVEMIQWDYNRAQVVKNDEVRAYLMSHGLPAEAVLFEADSAGAETYVTASGQNLISIGVFDDDFRFFIDIDTGSVFFGLDFDENPVYSNASPTFFVACVLLVEDNYPFYNFDDSIEVKHEAGQMLADSIRNIDATCLEFSDGFWSSFVHDVSIGDYYEGSI